MKSDSLENLETQSSDYLYNFITEKDSSQRKWKAMHILETRKLKPLADAAKYSAIAAIISAFVALVSLSLNFYLTYSKNVQSEPAQVQINHKNGNQK